jgi:glyoxylase-like metal-dependent hydrolase (beta-lactamase superfamily II)/8-oxo-dGTP pyrophosphatase MutT (NUDIX family)
MSRPIAPAASVILVRGEPLEVFIVQRADALRFFGGFYAFPGGRVHATDADVPVDTAGRERWLVDEVVPFCVAAIRELFEETGVLIARSPNGHISDPKELDRQRRLLNDNDKPFGETLQELGLSIRLGDVMPLGRLVTPPFTTMRFDTAFFLAELPPKQRATISPGELQGGYWTTPDAMLRRWESAECLISPPTVSVLLALRDCALRDAATRLTDLVRQAADRDTHLIYFAPDVQFIPLKSAVLPPSTHTNAFLVGRGPVYLIDPGASDPDEQRHLFAILDVNRAEGRGVTAVVLTHHHPDHVGAASACAERYRVPVWAHPLTAERLRGKVEISRLIHDRDRLPLGTAADGYADWHLRAIHTPGHAAGHLAFYDEHYGLLFAGDMVSTQTSVVIAPPEGDLSVYLASLRKLREFAGRLLLPSHGGPTARSLHTLDDAIEHRRIREEMLLKALGGEPQTIPQLAAVIYKGVPEDLMKFAQLQTLAGLQKLESEGRAVHDDEDRWKLAKPSGSSP